jgi:hypothetical protein
MSVKLLAASVLLFQTGALLVSVNIKFAQGLQTLDNLVFGRLLCAGWYLQLCNVKPTQDGSAPADRQDIYKNNSGTSKGIRPQISL